MKLTEKEKAARRAAFRSMVPAQKLDYLFTYYKWPILLALAALLILGSAVRRQLTKKEPVLYEGLVNVAAGPALEERLTAGFIAASGADGKKQEVYLYRDLYLSNDADTLNHRYAYASKVKVMGAIETQKLDVVLLNREGYELFSRAGYLSELRSFLSGGGPALLSAAEPLLVTGEVVVEDNAIKWELNEAEEHTVVTRSEENALELTALPMIRSAGFGEPIYLGVIANTPRGEAAAQYIEYLLEETE